MLFLSFVLVLPCILTAEIKSISCPDGTVCLAGTTCQPLESSKNFECRVLSAEELLNKKMVHGFASVFTLDAPVTTGDVCENGTVCDEGRCCPKLKLALCCKNLQQCCPEKSHCCGNETSTSWCCPGKSKCHENFGTCIAGASSVAPAIGFLMLAAVLLLSKNFA